MLTKHLLALEPDTYQAATHHPFLQDVGSLQVTAQRLSAWLIQDRFYINGYIHMLGAMISRLSLSQEQRPWSDNDPSWSAQRSNKLLHTLSFALSNILSEFEFFSKLLLRYGNPTDTPIHPLTSRYVDFQYKSVEHGGYDLGESIIVLWAMERVFYDAWSYAGSLLEAHPPVPGEDDHIKSIRELVHNWTLPAFGQFVEQCASHVDDLSMADPRRLASYERVYREMLAFEIEFWELADQ